MHCDFDTDIAQFSYSLDGVEFKLFAGELKLPFQLKTFRGVRYAFFHYNTGGNPGGHADFDNFLVDEPRARGTDPADSVWQRYRSLKSLSNGNRWPSRRTVSSDPVADPATAFRVVDRGRGGLPSRLRPGNISR